MWERILVIVKKEFRQTLREPRMRMMVIAPPILQLIVFGFAVNLDVENSRIAWMDLDRTPQSRQLRANFDSSVYFQIVAEPENEAAVRNVLDHGEAVAVVRVLPGFARDLTRGKTAAVQVLIDGTNSNSASIVTGYASRIIGSFGLPSGQTQPIEARTRVWFNPELKSRYYFIPGVLMNIIAIITLMLTAMAVVREKEIGTMEQLMVTPIRPIELIIGKTLPFICIGLFDVFLATGVALLIFHLPFHGSVLTLIGAAIVFLMTTLGAGLFISTISRTQQQALMSSFFFFMPSFMFSGFTFPIRNMPQAVQWLTLINPQRYFLEILRGIFLKGEGFSMLWPQMLALFIIGVVVLGSSTLRFHKTIE
jgi:ABC-2 type transport system permease protein